MKRSLHGARRGHKFAGALHIHQAIGGEDAKDYAGRAHRARLDDILVHYVEFIRGVAKVAATGPDHHKHIDGDRGADGAQQAGAGRDAAFAEGGAQFNALRSAGLSCDRRLHRIDTDFKKHDCRILFPRALILKPGTRPAEYHRARRGRANPAAAKSDRGSRVG
jgi:hypothetical protein